METAYPSSMGPSSFFYYNPEPLAENRQHGHFSPHPHHQYNAPMAYYPSNIHYAHQQPMLNPAMIYQQGLYQPNMITPLASPRPIYHRQTALIDRSSPLLYPLDTDCGPTTPPLSVSGSARSSPPSSSGILQTPVNGIQSFQEALAGIKQGCEGEVYTEIQGGKRWMSPSPPMTPGKPSLVLESSHSHGCTCNPLFVADVSARVCDMTFGAAQCSALHCIAFYKHGR